METSVVNPIGLTGTIELLLIDKKTQKVVQHVKQQNQITEQFARWLMMGNLGSSNREGFNSLSINPISEFLVSRSFPRFQAATAYCGATSGNNLFGIYLLSEGVRITPHTQIPPYLANNLNSYNPNLVVFYGTGDTRDDGLTDMVVVRGSSRWSDVGRNPAFTTTYMKTDGAGTIRSIVLGVTHGRRGVDGYQAYIATRQSPAVLPDGWDNTWNISTESITAATQRSRYLICPFTRESQIDGRYGDGLYADTGDIIKYYDLVSKRFENNTAGTIKTNDGTGETYHTDPRNFVSIECAGGYMIGNGKVIRVSKGASTTTTQDIIFYSQNTVNNPEYPTQANSRVHTYTYQLTGLTRIASDLEALASCAPVMVAKRGTTPEEDVIEVFCTTGINASGVRVQKIRLMVQPFRDAAANLPLGNVIMANSGMIEASSAPNVGVFHKPYAIGRTCVANSGTVAEAVQEATALSYTVGSYDTKTDCYYLPITHILTGCSLVDWSYDSTHPNATTLNSCVEGTGSQPGLMMDALLDRVDDCMFAVGRSAGNIVSPRITMLVTDTGLTPIIVNHSQRWSVSHGLVMSGLELETPIVKTDNEVLVVRYSYVFNILPETPARPLISAEQPLLPYKENATSLVVRWTPIANVERYILQRSTTSDFSSYENCRVPSPMLYGDTGVFLDSNIYPRTRYYYRMAAYNSGGTSDWHTANEMTRALTLQPVSPVDFQLELGTSRTAVLNWQWNQPVPDESNTVTDDITQFFSRFHLQYREAGQTTWNDVEDLANFLSDKNTRTFFIGNLNPETNYEFQLRAEIVSEYYDDVTLAVSGWTTLTYLTPALPTPTPVTGVGIIRHDYHYTHGDIRVLWNGQSDMVYDLNYRTDGAADWRDQPEITTDNSWLFENVQYNTAPSDTWSKFRTRIRPYNSSFPLGSASSVAAIAEEASHVFVVNRLLTSSDTNSDLLVTNMMSAAGETFGGLPVPAIDNIFNGAGCSNNYATGVVHSVRAKGDGTADLNTQTEIKMIVAYDNRIRNESPLAKCVAWKLPFRIYKERWENNNSVGRAAFNADVRLKLELKGMLDNNNIETIGTLADINPSWSDTENGIPIAPDVAGISTIAYPLVQVPAAQQHLYKRFIAEWTLTGTGENSIVSWTSTTIFERLIFTLYQWGIVAEG